jgi:Uma2 family endonuclease
MIQQDPALARPSLNSGLRPPSICLPARDLPRVMLVSWRMDSPKTKREGVPVRVEKRRFSVHEYHRMAEVGILSEDDRVELIEGEIVKMSPIGSRHAACVGRLNRLLQRLVGLDAIVRVQDPILLNGYSEPEPDVALVKPREDFYSREHPGPGDVLLLIEVADTSVERDLAAKLPLYAQAGIPEAWLVNLPAESIEVHSRPDSGEYRETVRTRRGETVTSRTIPGLEVAADDILG